MIRILSVLLAALLLLPSVYAQRILKAGLYTSDNRIPTTGHVKTQGLVQITGGTFDFDVLEVPKGSRFEFGGVERLTINRLIVSGGGSVVMPDGKVSTEPGVVGYPSTPNGPSTVNNLKTYLDLDRPYYETPSKRWSTNWVDGKTQTLELEAKRLTAWEHDYSQNRWLAQDSTGKMQDAISCVWTIDRAANKAKAVLTFSEALRGGNGRWWTDHPPSYQRNIWIGELIGYDCPISPASFYGTDGLFIGRIQASNRGWDCITIEYSRRAYIGGIVGGGNHRGYGGRLDLNLMFLTEEAFVGSGTGVVGVQPNGAPAIRNRVPAGSVIVNNGMIIEIPQAAELPPFLRAG